MSRRNRKTAVANSDPQPYDGPIQTVHGTRPFNRYLWPTECWLASDEIRFADPSYRIEIVELADGRWSTGGFVHEIERDRVISGEPCCFHLRTMAIRAQAARLIRKGRRDKRPDVVAWALRTVVKTTVTKPRLAAAEAYAERLSLRANHVERAAEQLDLFGAAA